MTPEERAREIVAELRAADDPTEFLPELELGIAAAIREAVAAERERIAAFVATCPTPWPHDCVAGVARDKIAEQIRARGAS